MEIKLEAVTKQYQKGIFALDNVSLQIPEGKFVSILGLSGAGKSTLLRCILGILPVDSGRIYFDQTDFTNTRGKQRKQLQRRMGMVFQNFCLVEESTALQNVLNACLYEVSVAAVLCGYFPKGMVRRAEECLRQVGMLDKALQLAGNLSGGEKQRIAIARVMMQRGEVILADEPVASLDPVNAEGILALLRKMQKEQRCTILMNSHNVEQARGVSDWVIGMRLGKAVFSGPPEKLTKEALLQIYGGEELDGEH